MENWANTEKAIEEWGNQLLKKWTDRLKAKGYKLGSSITAEYRWMGVKYQAIFNVPEYWKWVEYGRKPGKQPPMEKILTWVKSKGIKPLNKKIPEKSLAFIIARSIGKKGIKPKPMLRESKKEMQDPAIVVRQAMEKDIIKQIKER